MAMLCKLLFSSLMAMAASMSLEDKFKYGDKFEVSVISPEQASKLFADFKANKNLHWEYPAEGCHSRASEMTYQAEKMNIEMGKVFATGLFGPKSDDEMYRDLEWQNHVAPVVYVKEGDETVLKVFDPLLFGEPVPVAQWKKKLATSLENSVVVSLYYGARFQSDLAGWEKKKTRWHREDLLKREAEFRDIRDKIKETEALRNRNATTKSTVTPNSPPQVGAQ